MTFWAKLLSFLVLVLSIFFAAVSSVLFAKKQDWRGRYQRTVKEYTARQQEWDIEKKGLEDDRRDLRTEKDKIQVEKKQLELEKRNLENDVGRLKGQVQSHNVTITHLSSNLATMEELAKTWETKNEALRKERDKLSTELAKTLQELTDQQVQNSQQAKAIAELQDLRDKLKSQVAALEDTLAEKEQVLETIYDKVMVARPIIDRMLLVPSIRGKVLLVDGDKVIINVGAKQGVRRNHEFTVFRDDEFIAKIRIIDLQDGDLSAGQVIPGQQRKEIKLGDSVDTRIGI